MSKFEKSKDWSLFIEEERLFITKGADEIYFFDDVSKEQSTILFESYTNNAFNDLADDKQYKEILTKLLQAGVIYQKKFIAKNKRIEVFFKYFGQPNKSLEEEINSLLKRKNIEVGKSVDECDLLLVIRINEPLKNLIVDYEKIKVPHLFIDLGYANTISIGPLVFKGETACLNCFLGNLIKNWGDPLPPIEPTITRKYELVASFILERIEEYLSYGNCPDLVNGVWNFNTRTFQSNLDKTYKSPWCSICGDKKDNPEIDLPWIKELNHE